MGLGKKILKTTPVGYVADKAVERKNDPERQAAKAEADVAKQRADAGSLRSRLKEAQVAATQEREAKRQQGPVAKYTPTGFGAIRVYRDGTIESKHGSGSIIGATARVDQAGSQRIFRDTRQSYLTIEGPQVGISVKLGANSSGVVAAARKFAATVNKLAQQHGPATAPAPPTTEVSIPDQIGKLAELRDKGVLTGEEFEAKKAELLERM